ncbi:MAG: ABC transporter substrate-binding protein, partial [Chloroflexus sp.]
MLSAISSGVFAPIDSPTIEEAVPAEYRDPEGRWTSLALRARTVIYNPDRVDPADFDPVDTYASLADPQWRDRVCMRDAEEAYTQSLVAQMIDERGEEGAREVVEAWLANGTEI